MKNFVIVSLLLRLIATPVIAATPTAQKNNDPEPIKITVIATAYSPRVQETDSTPYITASGKHVSEKFIAANFLPFGTKVRIGKDEYFVYDRMNKRFTNKPEKHIDIFKHSTDEALRWGRRTIEMEILEIPVLKDTKTDEDISLRPQPHSAS